MLDYQWLANHRVASVNARLPFGARDLAELDEMLQRQLVTDAVINGLLLTAEDQESWQELVDACSHLPSVGAHADRLNRVAIVDHASEETMSTWVDQFTQRFPYLTVKSFNCRALACEWLTQKPAE